MNHPRKTERPQKRAVLIRKSKIFIKAKLTVSKSCLLGPAYFMIYCILRDAHLQNLSFLRGPSTESIFFNFSDIATYYRESKLEIAYFLKNNFQRVAIVPNNLFCLTFRVDVLHT